MFYIHDIAAISPVHELFASSPENTNIISGNKLLAVEPVYAGIPPTVLRRMGKAVRMSVGAALHIIQKHPQLDGVIIGTANGGMEDSIKFMNQIVQYEEGLLTPGNFVQSTPNGLASQIAFMVKNKNYNNTHVHRGLSFENALLDVVMLLSEQPSASYLLGGADEISSYNYNIDWLAGWYKKEEVSAERLFNSSTNGTIAGEGAAMFLVNNTRTSATAKFTSLFTSHSTDEAEIQKKLEHFLEKHLPKGEQLDLVLSGENGDRRLLPFYEAMEATVGENAGLLRFKHLCGEYPTASSFALWLSCNILQTQTIPAVLEKRKARSTTFRNLLVYNSFQGHQHSFMLISAVE
ncbi:MAG: beta-ketoacyl synthase chain length factor [bacterium]|nr:beta-ketoacyl synthase chain length factor [bacterium]